MDSLHSPSPLQARPESNLLSINTNSRSKSSSRSGSSTRSGSNSPGSLQGRQSYLSSVNGCRVSSPVLIRPGSTENFQPPSYSPRPPPLERQDTSLSLSYYYSTTGAGGPNSPVHTARSISSSSLYSDIPSPAGSGFGGVSGGEDNSRYLSSGPYSSAVLMPPRSSSKDETRVGREGSSRDNSNQGESLTGFLNNLSSFPPPIDTSEFGLVPSTDTVLHDSPTSSLRSSPTSSKKGTVTRSFRQSKQASPTADESSVSNSRIESLQRTSLLHQDNRSSGHHSPSRSPLTSNPSPRVTGDASPSPLGTEARQTSLSNQQQLPKDPTYSSFQQASGSDPFALSSRPLPVPNVPFPSPQEKMLANEGADGEEWAADIINELAMDTDSDDDDNDEEDGHDDQTNRMTARFETQNLGSALAAETHEPEHKQASRESSWERRKGAYRDHPPAPLINSWSTNLSSGPSGFLAEDESSPMSPGSDFYGSAASSPHIPIIQLKGRPSEHGQSETTNLGNGERGIYQDSDVTPRIRQVSQMNSLSNASTSNSEWGMRPTGVENDTQLPRTEDEGTVTAKGRLGSEAEPETETEVEGYESESSFDDGAQPMRRQRQSTEYWDPIPSSEIDSWFKKGGDSPAPKDRVATDDVDLSSSVGRVVGQGEEPAGSLNRGTGLSAARERAARAKTAYLASLPTSNTANGSPAESPARVSSAVPLSSSTNAQSLPMTLPTSNLSDMLSYEPRNLSVSSGPEKNVSDTSLSSSTSSSSSTEGSTGGMKRTFSRASNLSGSIGGPVSLDLQAETEIEEEEESRGRSAVSGGTDFRISRTPSPNPRSLQSSGRQYSHSKQLSTATIRPLSPPSTTSQTSEHSSGPNNLGMASVYAKPSLESSSAQIEHSLSHARTLEELTAAVDRAINDTDDPPNLELRMDFASFSSSQQPEPETDGTENARQLTRRASIASEASTWGDHAPPLTISISQHDAVDQLNQESDYVLVESPSFPLPGETYIPGDLVNLQRRPSYKGPGSTASRNAPVGAALSMSSSATLSELPPNVVKGSESASNIHRPYQQGLASGVVSNPLAPASAKDAAMNSRQPLEPVYANNYNSSQASQIQSQPIRPANKPYVVVPLGQWPKAMIYSDVKSAKTSGERALIYARKINELSNTEIGLKDWIKTVSGHRGSNRNTGVSRQQLPDEHQTDRKVSAASAVSEEAFPLRASGPSFQVQQIRNVSPPSGGPPPNLPYPQLAQGIGMRTSPSIVSLKSVSSRPSMSNSIANVAQGSGTFFQALGRRGSTSAGSNGGGSGGVMKSMIGGRTKSPPGTGVEDNGGRFEGRGSVSPMKGLVGGSSKAGGQKLGGPRSRNFSGAPSISNPINLNYTPPLPPRRSVDLDHQIQNRHVLFPIPQRASLSDMAAPRSTSLDYPMDANFEKNLKEMIGILQEEDQNVLAGYLRRANGSIPNAIGSFLEDQSRGSII